MIVCGTAPDGRPAPIVEIASLAPGEQLAFGENRWVWLNMSVQISVSYVPDARGKVRSAPVVYRSLLDPRGGIDGTEKVRMPVAPGPGSRMSPSTPVVDRTGLVPVFVIVAVPMIRPPSLRNEIWRTESGKGSPAVRTRARFAEPPARTGALAVNASERHTPTALISTSRSGRPAPARDSTDRIAALNIAPTNSIVSSLTQIAGNLAPRTPPSPDALTATEARDARLNMAFLEKRTSGVKSHAKSAPMSTTRFPRSEKHGANGHVVFGWKAVAARRSRFVVCPVDYATKRHWRASVSA